MVTIYYTSNALATSYKAVIQCNQFASTYRHPQSKYENEPSTTLAMHWPPVIKQLVIQCNQFASTYRHPQSKYEKEPSTTLAMHWPPVIKQLFNVTSLPLLTATPSPSMRKNHLLH